jgi:hypothetical protein
MPPQLRPTKKRSLELLCLPSISGGILQKEKWKKKIDTITFFGCLINLELPQVGTSAIAEKLLTPTPEAVCPELAIAVEFTPGGWKYLHFVLCPDFQCASWHFWELEKTVKVYIYYHMTMFSVPNHTS